MSLKTKNVKKIAAVSLFGLLFLFSGKAQAIEYGMLGGKPANPDSKIENSGSWFIYNLKAGESKQDALTVMNLFDTPLDIVLYPADSTNSSNGGFALKQMTEAKEEVGSWVKFYATDPPEDFVGIFQKHDGNIVEFCALNESQLQDEYGKNVLTSDQFSAFTQWCQGTDLVEKQFKAKETTNISFVISIPTGADVGEHTGGILIQKKLPDDQAGPNAGSTVKLTTRVGVRIYETVPGDIIKKMSLDDFKVVKNFSEFTFTDWFGEKKQREYLVQSNVSNSGNVSIEHENNVIVTNLLSSREPQVIGRKFQVLKKDKFISNMPWTKPLFGYYAFQSQVKYQNSNGQEEILLSQPIKVLIMPWRELALLLVLVGILWGSYATWKCYQKKKYGGIDWVEYVVKKTDTIAKLAEKHDINWIVLTKTNKIKAPYLLEAGQTILVPADEKSLSEKNDEDGKDDKDDKSETAKKKKTIKTIASEKTVKKITLKAKKNEPIVVAPKNLLIWKVLAAIVVVSVVVAVFWMLGLKYKKNNNIPSQSISINSLAEDNQVVSPVENKDQTAVADNSAEKIDPAKLNVAVINGGGVAGAAGKVKDFLVGNGYSLTEAKNAESSDHTATAVLYSDEKFKQEAGKINDILQTKKILATVSQASSDEEKSADIVVMLGK